MTTTFTGTAGNDSLTGTNGNDFLDGAAGADTLTGLAGDDVYLVDDPADVVVEAPGGGTDRVNSLIDYTLGANVEDLWLVGSQNTSGTGNELANVLWGNAGANILDGQGGNDFLDGGAGADTLIGGLGDDTYRVDDAGDQVVENPGEGNDTVYSSLANYTLGANVENLNLGSSYADTAAINGTGNALANILQGDAGDNVLDGAAGDDQLNGWAGADTLIGGQGDDTYWVDNAGDTVVEHPGEGTDTVYSSLANYTLGANVENLYLGYFYATTTPLNGTGNALDNILHGNAGDNILDGGAGNDTLIGGDGNDTLTGGSGQDVFYLSTGDTGTDTITDLAVGDVIEICGAFLNGPVSDGDGTAVGAGEVQLATANGVTTLFVGTDSVAGADTEIVLDGTYHSGDFIVSGFNLIYDHAPEAGPAVGNQNAVAGASYVFQLPGSAFSDADGADTLRYSALLLDEDWNAADLPAWLHFDAATGTFSGTPANGDVGSLNITVFATDLAGMGASTSFTLQIAAPNLIYGNSLNNTLLGSAGDDQIFGLAGNDKLVGNAGNDRLDGGTGNDTLFGGAGSDTYVVDAIGDKVYESATASGGADAGAVDTVVSSVNWTLGNYVENLNLAGGANINGTGNALANVLLGNNGNNILDGKGGLDSYAGGLGNDRYVVDQAAELLNITEHAGEGNDTLQIAYANTSATLAQSVALTGALSEIENIVLNGNGLFNLTGNAQDNVLTGNAAANVLTGGAGNDTLSGGAGNDTLIGGDGADLLSGGAGRDLFVFNALSEMGDSSLNWDVISDFVRGQDRIDLSALDADAALAGDQAFKAPVVGGAFSAGVFTTAGTLYFDKVAHVLYGNTDGDSAAEFAIKLTGNTLTAADLIL